MLYVQGVLKSTPSCLLTIRNIQKVTFIVIYFRKDNTCEEEYNRCKSAN